MKPPMPPLRRALLTLGAEMVIGWLLGYGLVLLIGKGSWGAIAGFLFGMVLGAGIALAVGLVTAARVSGRPKSTQVWLCVLALPAAFVSLPIGARMGLGGWGTLALMLLPGPALVWWLAANPAEEPAG